MNKSIQFYLYTNLALLAFFAGLVQMITDGTGVLDYYAIGFLGTILMKIEGEKP